MSNKESPADLTALPGNPVYLVVMLVLLLGTAVSLAVERFAIGVAAFILLALMALAYGAAQTGEEMP